ncbi:MAG TPA: helix-turn-helix transcriptional regulator [Devosia sp.]|nr:helix-turn-helix transcriptional regulator [Devosia sp.]
MVKLSAEQFADVTSILFAAALDPTRWQDFLDRLSTHLGVINTHLYGYDVAANLGLQLLYHGYDPDFMRSYTDYYGAMNSWAPGLASASIGVPVTSAQSLPEDELFKTTFYNEWVRPQGDIRTGAGVVLAKGDSRFFVLGGNMGQQHAKHEQDWLDTLTLLTPHMRRALEISRTLFDQSVQLAAAQALGPASAGGALLALSVTRKVIYANATAAALAEGGMTLRYDTFGKLHFVDAEADRALHHALGGMARRLGTPSSSLQLRGQLGAAMQVRFARIESERLGFMPLGIVSGSDEPHLLVSIAGAPMRDQSGVWLRQRFGLTESEFKVADLIAAGLTSREIAEGRQVSLHTVRGQIKAALNKTGLRRQVELVRLLQEAREASGQP